MTTTEKVGKCTRDIGTMRTTTIATGETMIMIATIMITTTVTTDTALRMVTIFHLRKTEGARMTRKLMPVVLLLFLVSLPTFGQKAEFFGGYQLTHFDGGPTSNGWNAAVTGNFLPFLGVTADFSGVYNSGTHFYTYTFGPEVHARALGVKPFAHALFGGGTFSGGGVNSTGLTTYLGGGVDVKILPFVSARLAQVDWMTTRFSGVTNKNNMRYSAGLVLRF